MLNLERQEFILGATQKQLVDGGVEPVLDSANERLCSNLLQQRGKLKVN